jgi:hypothetical protein
VDLAVIGSGFGRTGTRSLKQALEMLGLGPCHHMEEVFANPGQVPYWQQVAAGHEVDWRDVFAGYHSQVDWPGAHVWRELAAALPDARVIHTTRPEEAWWNSFSQTIGRLLSEYGRHEMPPHIADMTTAMNHVIGTLTFGGRWTDHDSAIAAFRRREADVRAAIPAERLLVFDVAQGWEPLCAFLDRPVPNSPFPRRNDRTEFWENFADGVPEEAPRPA